MHGTPGPGETDITLDLNELCRQGEVTPRTVRYYIQQGLLPSPGLGAGARYGPGHLARLRLIRRMQREHLPLAEIRRQIEGLDDETLRGLVESPPAEAARGGAAAVDYVRAVLHSTTPAAAPRARAGSGTPARPATSPGTGPVSDRARWDRIALTPDIELHVRRPLSREDNRRVEKLLEQARAILED